MREKRFKQFGLWIIDDPNSNVNSVADLIDTKLMSTNEVVVLLNEQQATIQLLKDFIKKEFPKSYKHILEGLDGVYQYMKKLKKDIGGIFK